MKYAEAEEIVCDGIAKFCEALLENGFTHSQMELVDRALSDERGFYDSFVELVIQAKSVV